MLGAGTVAAVAKDVIGWLRALAVLGAVAFVVVTAVLSIFGNEDPADRKIRGTIIIERCEYQVGVEATCYGPFTSEDGTVRIAEVGIRTDVRNTTVAAQVDSATDTLAERANEPSDDSLFKRIAIAVVIMALAGALLVLPAVIPHDPPDPYSD